MGYVAIKRITSRSSELRRDQANYVAIKRMEHRTFLSFVRTCTRLRDALDGDIWDAHPACQSGSWDGAES